MNRKIELSENVMLSVDHLSVSFLSEDGIVEAVKDVSFEVKKGSTLAIVGESGSGKSVSCLSIMNLLPAKTTLFPSGNLHFSSSIHTTEQMVGILRPEDPLLNLLRGKSVAMIFQEPMTALNPVMKCGDQIIEMIRAHAPLSKRDARERAFELLNEVQLPNPKEALEKYPHQMSGGQRQRVMIAMAISCQPQLLIADEPTTALDVTVQRSILELLKSLQRKYNMSLIFITHDLGIVEELADYVLVMKKGEVIESGTAKEVLNDPSEIYTKSLLACRPRAGVKLERLPTPDKLHSQEKKDEDLTNDHVLLSAQNLVKSYSSGGGIFGKGKVNVALDHVSFSIFKGETLGLVGESGCGKTTLSRILTGLIQPDSGSVLFDGIELKGLGNSELQKFRKRVQLVFQDPYSSLNPKMTIGDAISEPMKGGNRKNHENVFRLLEQVGMPRSAVKKYPHEFSGGQRQRIVIARALAVQPEFLVCDESVSALDVSVQAQVLNLLNDLKQELGLTYLFISHDLAVVYQMSDRIMVMNKGKIEELGTAKDVFFHPDSTYTRRLIDAIPGDKRI